MKITIERNKPVEPPISGVALTFTPRQAYILGRIAGNLSPSVAMDSITHVKSRLWNDTPFPQEEIHTTEIDSLLRDIFNTLRDVKI